MPPGTGTLSPGTIPGGATSRLRLRGWRWHGKWLGSAHARVAGDPDVRRCVDGVLLRPGGSSLRRLQWWLPVLSDGKRLQSKWVSMDGRGVRERDFHCGWRVTRVDRVQA